MLHSSLRVSIVRSAAALWLLAGAAGMLMQSAGCTSQPRPAPGTKIANAIGAPGSTSRPDTPLTDRQLQASLMGFADRFISHVEEATDSIQARTTDPRVREQAQSAKYYPSLSVVTMAADTDPAAALLDIATMTTLQCDVWRNGWAKSAFGDLAQPLLDAGDAIQADIWSIVDKVLTDQQQQTLRDLIAAWQAEHPSMNYVAMVRFDDFTSMRGDYQRRSRTLLQVNLVLSGTDEAARQVREARIFAERALFLAARMPLLLAWQAELLAYDLALAPEVRQAMDNANTLAASVKQLSDDVHQLPEQLDVRQERLSALVTDIRGALNDAQKTSQSVDATAGNLKAMAGETTAAADAITQMMKSTDQMLSRFDNPAGGAGANATTQPAGHPFDIREYTQSFTQLASTARELNSLVQQTDATLASPAWQQRVGEVDRAAEARLNQLDTQARDWLTQIDSRARDWSDSMFTRGVWLIGIAAGAALVVAILMRFILRR